MENFNYLSEKKLKEIFLVRKIGVIMISLTPLFSTIYFNIIFEKTGMKGISYNTVIIIGIIIFIIGTIINKAAYKIYKEDEKNYFELEKIKTEILAKEISKITK